MSETQLEIRYESRDASGLGVTITAVALICAGVGIALGTRAVFESLRAAYPTHAPRPFRPPGPRLQTDEPADLAAYRAREQRLLDSYGRGAHGRHIPITRAMELLSHD